jgi:hypothetical protein
VQTAILRLTPEAGSDNTARRWKDLFEVARQGAPFLPDVVDDLVQMLAEAWPVSPSPLPFTSLLDSADDVVLAAAAAGEAAAGPDEASATSAALALFTLLGFELNRSLPRSMTDSPARALARLASPPASTVDGVLTRRQTLLRVLDDRWQSTSFTSPTVRDRVATAMLEAVKALGSPLAERRELGTVNSAMELRLGATALPADERTRQTLNSAVDLAILLLEDLGADALPAYLDTMRQLRACGRVGLPFAGGPLESQLRQLVEDSVDRLEEALAARWYSLPLLIRRAAAIIVLDLPRGATGRSLFAQRDAGSPIAAVAAADEQLRRLFVLFPDDASYADDYEAARRQHAQAAAELANQLEIDQAVALLDNPATDAVSGWDTGPLRAFATTVGRRLGPRAALQVVLDRLRREIAVGAREWLPALAEGAVRDDADIANWVTAIASAAGLPGVTVVLPALDAMDETTERALLAALVRRATQPVQPGGRTWSDRLGISAVLHDAGQLLRVSTGKLPGLRRVRAVERLTSRIRRATLSKPTAFGASGEAGQQFVLDLAHHAWVCKRLADPEKAAVLLRLALDGPEDALPGALRYLALAKIQPEQAPDLDLVLRRRMQLPAPPDAAGPESPDAQASTLPPGPDHDHDLARAIGFLGGIAPDRLADLLADWRDAVRGKASSAGLLPYAWEAILQGLPADSRTTLAHRLLPWLLTSTGSGGHLDDEADLIWLIGHDTPPVAAQLRTWTEGSPDERAAALRLLTRAWQSPLYTEIVPKLLASGLAPDERTRLQRGLLPTTIGPDLPTALAQRRAVLEPWTQHQSPRVREHARAVLAELNRQGTQWQTEHERHRRGYD